MVALIRASTLSNTIRLDLYGSAFGQQYQYYLDGNEWWRRNRAGLSGAPSRWTQVTNWYDT